MVAVEVGERLHIPGGIGNLEEFLQWARSKEFPEQGRYAFLRDRIWVDLDMEELFTHNRVKTHISSVLNTLIESAQLGLFFSDGARLTNKEASLSTEPDGVFVAVDTVQKGRVVFEENAARKRVELIGSPDMVLEIVSDSSVRKDTRQLRELYWLAGVLEYWLVDARKETLTFQLFKHGAKGFTTTRPQDGWLKSKVLGRFFRLTTALGVLNLPGYKLEVRT